ncbi:AAA domain-containing protein [Streptomyces cyaneofuscatus]|uniref:AAA domain-containing protein n=1 Tax=Streptomyces cyaneofuscatus TaxID=66883 RepID=UPI002E165100|nr:AAA domain-containing protein [Streptomyces cyaneofuscatus]WSI52197.1 AAA domain-containing protein [Streptomyces cyaneofuscatus]
MSQDERGLGEGLRPVGSVYQYDDGLYVRVDDVVPYVQADAEGGHGYREGDDLVRCTLYLSNGTGGPLDVDGVTLLVRGGPYGKTGRQVRDHRGDVLDDELKGTLRAGRRVSVTWAYSIPAGTAGDLDIEVRFPGRDRESVTFGTAQAAASVVSGRPVPMAVDQSVLFGERQQSLFADPDDAPGSGAGYTVSAAGGRQATAPAVLDAVPAQPAAPGRRTARSPVPQVSADSLDAARVRQIFRFLAEAEESKTRPVRTLDGAAGTVWFDELPDDDGVEVMTDGALAGDDPAWLTVARPEREDAPHPEALLAPWVDGARIRDFREPRAPHLRRRIEPEFPDWSRGIPLDKTYHELDEHPRREKIEKLYAAWEQEWLAWAERRRAIDPAVRLYDRLHKMHEDAAGLGEAYELVLGLGRLTWQTTAGQRVERHLITHRATIRLDPSTGTLTAAPDPTGAGLELEEGMLEGAQHVPGAVRETIVEVLEDALDVTDPEHLDAVHTALRSWVNAAHSAGSYAPTVERAKPRSLDVPQVGLAPALVLRERSRRSTMDALKAIARQIDAGTPPTALLGHIAGRDGALTAADLAAAEDDGTVRGDDEMYFALPANEEQRTIAERLRANRLVVVQGPPGTGKTHTIANLVTDLLAQGKRVLITSHTPRALRVLRDKLPESIRDLCVSRTEDGAAAQRELESSVQRILGEYAGYDEKASGNRIRTLQTRLAQARAAQQAMLRDLAVLREQETHRFEAEIGDYSGSLQEIAERLTAEAGRYDWLGPVPQEQPALSAEETLRLLHATRAYTPHHQALAAEVPGPSDLPGPGDFEEAVRIVRSAEEAHTAARQDPLCAEYDTAVRSLGEGEQQRLSSALDAFSTARARAAALAAAAGDWATTLLREVTEGQDWQARSRRAAVTEALAAVDSSLAVLGTAMVSGLEQYDPATALAQVTTLHDGLGQGQKLRGPLGMRSKLAKAVGAFAESVRVDGRAPEDVPTSAVVLARVQLELRLAQVESEWGTPVAAWQGHGPRLARLRQDAEALDALLAVAAARTDVLTAAATSPALAVATWHDPSVESAVRILLRASTTLRAAEQSRKVIADTEELLRAWGDRPGVSPAVVRALGTVRDRDPDGYRAFSDEMAEVREAVRLRAEQDVALARVREAFPALADRIVRTHAGSAWDTGLPSLAAAWAWSAWRDRMERLTDPEAERTLRRRLTEADDEARIMLARLAAARAWHRCLGLLTGDQSRALSAYQQAARRIKGKYQHRYRRDAQAALRKAQTAVPAWIMPLHQVAETVPMDRPGLFDVVIVDEASQSGLEAMLLSWLADRMVVVGDSKQVSPSNVGLKQDEYFHLRDRLLTALEPDVRSLFGPESSFFDLTEALSAGRGTLMLKEHFRCMPEIISFSNDLCYNRDLLPLRQYGADRLPPVRTVYVETGEAVGANTRLTNVAEAEALVDAIVRCCADPAYDGKTMGVISLRASKGHLTELENLLAERLDYEQREERRIRVGDAEDFQGDERHVLFVSFVNSATTAAGAVPGGFNGRTYEQRINVAASRAQDQVWVFHSARAEQFHENDLRRRWLDHLTRPAEEDVVAVEGEVLPDVRHEAFDSLFQQQVYLELTARGHRVRPGYKVGRHTIDLVVEGGTRRLAVACDGDAFAEGEDASTAAARQRDLERVDWTFVRIRGSRFHLDREQALAPLWAELERLGIEPVGREPEDSGAIDDAATGGTEAPGEAAAGGDMAAGGDVAEAGRMAEAGHAAPAGDVARVEAGGAVVAGDGVSSEPRGVSRHEAGSRDTAPAAAAPGVVPAPRTTDPRESPGGRVGRAMPAPTRPRVATSERGRLAPAREVGATVSEAAPAVRQADPARSAMPTPTGQGFLPVREIPAAAFQRLVRETQRLQAAVDAPHETPAGTDAAQLVFLRRTQAEQRDRRAKRLAFLRTFLDAVGVGREEAVPEVVIPGALLRLEFDGQLDEDTLYTIAELPTEEADIVSPSSPLGHALVWQPAGREISYDASQGKARTVVVREIRV